MILKTPQDIGLTVRARRRALGWDQRRLAAEVGVTRQWVIALEKGNPGAAVELVLRALRVLAIDIVAQEAAKPTGSLPIASAPTPGGFAESAIDLDAVIANARRRRS